ncbi:MAG: hypothetical protein K6C94_09305 [Candidatus Gastranaerophilales bacterium]|nr:hypothetical protein [Candidatus Gastranaerophilales bacterium]
MFCFPVKADDEDGVENYLIGMTVAKSFGNNYEVYLKLKQNTDRTFKLKDLGNSNYALILPQIKTLIDAHEIIYETEHKDIRVIISEKRDLTDRTKFYTKINFKTKNDALIHIEAYASKSSKTQVVLQKTPEEIKKTEDNTVPNWIWFVPVLILSVICILLLIKPDDEEFSKSKKKKKKKRRQEEYISESYDRNYSDDDIAIPDENTSIKDFLSQKTDDEPDENQDESDKIVDELVKLIIPENDLVLMPGVPELPGLEKNENKSRNTKIILKNVKIDLFDALDGKNTSEPRIPYIPQKMSLSERLKNKDLIREADDIIFSEREAFFDTISSIGDIADDAREDNEENENNLPETDENTVVTAETENQTDTEAEAEQQYIEQDKYDKLINAFKKSLFIAHKLQDEDSEEMPDIIDSFGVSDTIGFNLVKYGNKVSFVGNIEQNVFVLKTFNLEEVEDELLYMEYCTQTPYSATYSVIINRFKALVKVSETEISLIGEYE